MTRNVEAVALVVTTVLVIVTDLPIAIPVGLSIAMILHIRKEPAIVGKGFSWQVARGVAPTHMWD